MCEYLKNPDAWVSLSAILISLVALFQTHRQIQISNRQQLFDRRLENYLLLKDLSTLYEQNQNFLKDEKMVLYTVDIMFCYFSNCSYLENMTDAIRSPLKNPGHDDFLRKCEWLKRKATEISLIWNGEEGYVASNFVLCYKELLHSMYRQQIILKKIEEENQKTPLLAEDHVKRASESAENTGLNAAIESITNAYKQLKECNAESKLLDELKF